MAATCSACGTALAPIDEEAAPGRDDERGDIETVEAARSLATAGYETEFAFDGEIVACAVCGHRFTRPDSSFSMESTDTTSGAQTVDVVTVICPSCHAHGHVLAPRA